MIFFISIISLLLTFSYEDGYTKEGLGRDIYVKNDSLYFFCMDMDIDDNGSIDLVFANEFEWLFPPLKQKHDTYSYLIFGDNIDWRELYRDSFYTHGAECSAMIDVNNDELTDLIFANSTYNYSYIFIRYSNTWIKDSFYAPFNHGGIEYADLNNDGKVDLLWTAYYSNYAYIYYNTGKPPYFDTLEALKLNIPNSHGSEIYDIDSDGFLDLLITSVHEDGKFYILYGPDYIQIDSFKIPSPGDDISIGDFDKNSFIDILIPSHSRKGIFVLKGVSKRFFLKDSLEVFNAWSSTCNDFNNDGYMDIAINTEDRFEPIYIFKGTPKGLKFYQSLPVMYGSGIKFVDLDKNGFKDLIVGDQSLSKVFIYWNKKGVFNAYNHSIIQTKAVDASLTRDLIDTFFYLSPIIETKETRHLDSIVFKTDTIWKGSKNTELFKLRLDVRRPEEKIYYPPKAIGNVRRFQIRIMFVSYHIASLKISPLHIYLSSPINEETIWKDFEDFKYLSSYDACGRRLKNTNNFHGIMFNTSIKNHKKGIRKSIKFK